MPTFGDKLRSAYDYLAMMQGKPYTCQPKRTRRSRRRERGKLKRRAAENMRKRQAGELMSASVRYREKVRRLGAHYGIGWKTFVGAQHEHMADAHGYLFEPFLRDSHASEFFAEESAPYKPKAFLGAFHNPELKPGVYMGSIMGGDLFHEYSRFSNGGDRASPEARVLGELELTKSIRRVNGPMNEGLRKALTRGSSDIATEPSTETTGDSTKP